MTDVNVADDSNAWTDVHVVAYRWTLRLFSRNIGFTRTECASLSDHTTRSDRTSLVENDTNPAICKPASRPDRDRDGYDRVKQQEDDEFNRTRT